MRDNSRIQVVAVYMFLAVMAFLLKSGCSSGEKVEGGFTIKSGCSTSDDCGTGYVCDSFTHQCVEVGQTATDRDGGDDGSGGSDPNGGNKPNSECFFDSECLEDFGSGHICVDNGCVTGCSSDKSCDSWEYCNQSAGNYGECCEKQDASTSAQSDIANNNPPPIDNRQDVDSYRTDRNSVYDCTVDSDCGEGERCSGGYCILLTQRDAGVEDDSGVSTFDSSTTTTDADVLVPDGMVPPDFEPTTDGSVATDSADVMPECRVDIDCDPWEICSNGYCVDPTVADAGVADVVQVDVFQSDVSQFDAGQTDVEQIDVAQTDVAQIDVAQSDVGQTDVEVECHYNSDCDWGHYCADNQCHQDCTSNEDCSAGDYCEVERGQCYPMMDAGVAEDVVAVDVVQTDVAQSDVAQEDLAQSDVEPDVVQSDVDQSDMAQSDIAQTDMVQQDVTQTDVVQSDVATNPDWGWIADCVEDRDCPFGSHCHEGYCRTLCDNSLDCPNGHLCDMVYGLCYETDSVGTISFCKYDDYLFKAVIEGEVTNGFIYDPEGLVSYLTWADWNGNVEEFDTVDYVHGGRLYEFYIQLRNLTSAFRSTPFGYVGPNPLPGDAEVERVWLSLQLFDGDNIVDDELGGLVVDLNYHSLPYCDGNPPDNPDSGVEQSDAGMADVAPVPEDVEYVWQDEAGFEDVESEPDAVDSEDDTWSGDDATLVDDLESDPDAELEADMEPVPEDPCEDVSYPVGTITVNENETNGTFSININGRLSCGLVRPLPDARRIEVRMNDLLGGSGYSCSLVYNGDGQEYECSFPLPDWEGYRGMIFVGEVNVYPGAEIDFSKWIIAPSNVLCYDEYVDNTFGYDEVICID